MFRRIIIGLIFYCCFYNTNGFSQEQLSYLVELNSTFATKSTVPFWLTANRFGTIPNYTNTLINGALFSDFKRTNNSLSYSYKAAVTAYSGDKNAVFINELYGAVKYKNWYLDLGVKHPEVLWEGLSSSNGNISKSTNARSYPGFEIYLKEYTKLPFAKNWLSVKGNYGDFLLNDKRSITNTKLHSKSLYFKSKLSQKLVLISGINHYAQWAGTSSLFGKQPSGIKNYFKVITGGSGGSDALKGDQINVLGNQLGSYLIQLEYYAIKNNYSFYWSHPFEDRSGREMMNYPDALYGFFIDFKNPNATVSHLSTELTYTKHASGNAPHYTDDQGYHAASGMDNYFNNGVYQSGWTYFGNMIGSPYFTTKPVDDNGITPGIIDGDNRFMALNLGVKGIIKKLKYKAILSHIAYVGWFGSEYVKSPTQTSGLLEITDINVLKLPLEISIGTAFDTGTYRPVNFGGFLKLTKKGAF